jgi:predicted  nucleic acid-binding Zn-ribbon protein
VSRQVQALQAQAVALRAELATAKNLAEDLQAQLNVAEESIATLQQTVAELEQAVRCERL